MCEPVSIGAFTMTAMETAMVGTAAASAALSMYASNKSATAQGEAINQEAEIRGKEMQAQAGQQEEEGLMRSRAERAQSIAAASGSGVNLGSNSFMASLQTTTMNQANESGLILENEKNQQQANTAETQSLLNEKATSSTFLGATLNVALAGGSAYMKGRQMTKLGADKPTPNV